MEAPDPQVHQNPFSRKQPSSSTCSYFTEHPIRVGSQIGNSGGGGHVGPWILRGPSEMRDAIQREREKDKIRAEIIAEEVARRRILEAEVRNELRMEREMMAMRTGGGGGGFFSPFMMQPCNNSNFDRRILHRQQPIGLEERIGMSLQKKHPHGGNCFEFRGFEVAPFQGIRESPKIESISTNLALPDDTKKEVILLGNGSQSGTKRKSAPVIVEDSTKPHSDGPKKKLKEEWSCAVCQVSATSERGLTEHLKGKKHQSKEAALIAQRSGAHFGLGVSPKKPIVKPIKISLTTAGSTSSEKKSKTKTKTKIKTKKESNKETSNSPDVKKEKGSKKSDKYKFWCETCEVGAFSEKVMNHHKGGKKHLTRLMKLLQKGKMEVSETSKAEEAVVNEDVKQDEGSNNVMMAVEEEKNEVKEVKKSEVKKVKQDEGSNNVTMAVEEEKSEVKEVKKSEVKKVIEDASIHLIMGL